MKRTAEKYQNVALNTIYNHYGLLCWQECLFCGKEFRREKGYRFQLQVNRNWVYSCGECCSCKAEVNDKVGEIRSNRPKPPAPPKKR